MPLPQHICSSPPCHLSCHHLYCVWLCRKMRVDCLLKVRWQQRMLRADVKENMSPQEQQVRAGSRTAAFGAFIGIRWHQVVPIQQHTHCLAVV